MRGTGCADNVLFDHDASEIICTAMKTDLCNLFTNCQPAGLDIFYIRQHHPADSNHPDIFLRCGKIMNPPDLCEKGIYILECPWNKCQKTFCLFRFLVLHFPDFCQVFKPFFNCFYMSKHHRCTGSYMEFMCLTHDIQPFPRGAFALAD